MSSTARKVIAAAIAIGALAWVDPLFVPLVTLGPLVSGSVAGVRGAEPRHVALAWFCGGLLMLVSDLAINGEDVRFHAGVAVFTAALGAGAAALGRRRRGAPAIATAVAATVALAALGGTPSADAQTAVSEAGGTVTVTGGAEANDVTLTTCLGGCGVRIEDSTAGAIEDGGCAQVSPDIVECPPAPTVDVALGDGDDSWSHAAGDTAAGIDEQFLAGDGGDDTIIGTSSQVDDTIDGGAGDDTLWGNGGRDTIHGNTGNDEVLGGSENDSVFGDEGNDTVRGERNDDHVDGGPGADTLSGDSSAATTGDGNDRIASRDGEVDQVSCGFGADIVTADGVDVIDRGDCESVDSGSTPSTPPAPSPPATPSPQPGAPPPAQEFAVQLDTVSRLKLRTLLTSGFRFAASSNQAAHTDIVLFVPRQEAKRIGLGRKDVVLASASQNVAAGAFSATIRVRGGVARKLRRLRPRSVHAIAGLVATNGTGQERADADAVALRR